MLKEPSEHKKTVHAAVLWHAWPGANRFDRKGSVPRAWLFVYYLLSSCVLTTSRSFENSDSLPADGLGVVITSRAPCAHVPPCLASPVGAFRCNSYASAWK